VIKASGKNLDDWIRRLFPFLFRWELDPNALTVTGALVSTGAAAAFAAGSPRAAGLLMLAGGFFDLVDGVVARHRGVATRFGAFLDSTLDRWVDVVLLVGISVHYAGEGAPQHVALAGLALATTVLVSYTKARAELVLGRFEIGLLERAERVVILAAGALFGLIVAALWIIAIGSAITAGQRIALAYREMQRLDAADASKFRAASQGRAKTIELENP
jgi:CDP-diacylglycerol--glycerol-3-phosphate 3-phosphatidyltransferase